MHDDGTEPARAPTDEALMLAYGRGDVRAFEALYARHKAGTYRYFLRHTNGDSAVADELHQDLWMRVIDARERYEVRASFATWLYTLARHRLVDHWRSRGGAVSFASLDDDGVLEQAEESAAVAGDGGGNPMYVSIDAEVRERLLAALAGIPPLQRDAFLLHIEGGLSLDAIASLTSTSGETVKSRLRYAYRRLRAALEDRP
jgi:RNA polymerase sigma-70 factor (ECF subfamily)